MSPKIHALSNVYGKIQQLLMLYVTSSFNIEQVKATFQQEHKGILSALPSDISYTVLVLHSNGSVLGRKNKPDNKSIHGIGTVFGELFKESNNELLKLHILSITSEWVQSALCSKEQCSMATNRLSKWVQDRFIVMQTTDGIQVLLEPAHASVNNILDDLVVDILVRDSDFLMNTWRHQIDGGNVLVSSNTAFISVDATVDKDSREDIRRQLGMETVHWIEKPTTSEVLNCLPHLDFFLTPGGKCTVQNGGISTHKETVFLGRIQPTPEDKNSPLGLVDSYLDSVGTGLRRQGIDVVEIPLIADTGRILSYNNCLVEVYTDQRSNTDVRKVYMPVYSQGYKNDTQWQDLENKFGSRGFSVVPVPKSGDFKSYADSRGSLHCMTKELKRSRCQIRL